MPNRNSSLYPSCTAAYDSPRGLPGCSAGAWFLFLPSKLPRFKPQPPLSPSLPRLSTQLPSSAALRWVWIYWKTSKPNLRRCFSRGWELCPTCSTLKASHGRLAVVGQSCWGKMVAKGRTQEGLGSNSLDDKGYVWGCAASFCLKPVRGIWEMQGEVVMGVVLLIFLNIFFPLHEN